MKTIEEKIQLIEIPLIAKRIKRELQDMKQHSFFNNDSDVDIIKVLNEKEFYLIIKNEGRLYKFRIPYNYPFHAPKFFLNNKHYSHYFKFKSSEFRDKFYKNKFKNCFCCQSILCSNNWGPHLNISKIIEEVNTLYNDCRKIIDAVIIDVIKRKYLIDDVNILEWLY